MRRIFLPSPFMCRSVAAFRHYNPLLLFCCFKSAVLTVSPHRLWRRRRGLISHRPRDTAQADASRPRWGAKAKRDAFLQLLVARLYHAHLTAPGRNDRWPRAAALGEEV